MFRRISAWINGPTLLVLFVTHLPFRLFDFLVTSIHNWRETESKRSPTRNKFLFFPPLIFVFSYSCFSRVGRAYTTPGYQTISIGFMCDSEPIILHEMLHAVGEWQNHKYWKETQYICIRYSPFVCHQLYIIWLLKLVIWLIYSAGRQSQTKFSG